MCRSLSAGGKPLSKFTRVMTSALSRRRLQPTSRLPLGVALQKGRGSRPREARKKQRPAWNGRVEAKRKNGMERTLRSQTEKQSRTPRRPRIGHRDTSKRSKGVVRFPSRRTLPPPSSTSPKSAPESTCAPDSCARGTPREWPISVASGRSATQNSRRHSTPPEELTHSISGA